MNTKRVFEMSVGSRVEDTRDAGGHGFGRRGFVTHLSEGFAAVTWDDGAQSNHSTGLLELINNDCVRS